MEEKEIYLIKRRRKKIRQTELATVLNCSQSLISRHEKDDCDMADYRVGKYREYIDEK